MSRRALWVAAAASAAVILSSPFIRDIRDWIRNAFPGQYATVIAVAVAIAIGAALIVAVVRIRERRAMRYGAIIAALGLGSAYAAWNAQGIPEVDAVERVHFVEYGVITLLFARAWRSRGDASMFLLPMLAGLAVGTLEEWLQWFIPGRVGDMRDVVLNGTAIVCGLLFSMGIDPPDAGAFSLRSASVRLFGFAAAAVTVLFAAFVYSVHVGYEIHASEAVTFRSRYDAETLRRLGQDRTAHWRTFPPTERPRSRSREDQYMSEGLLHAQERNRRWGAGDVRAAWSENLILERYYSPLLDTPSYISPTGERWPAELRADAERRVAATGLDTHPYSSQADASDGQHFIRLWAPATFWLIVGLVAGTFLIVALRTRETTLTATLPATAPGSSDEALPE